ncbi:MAG TPA: protein kinase [Steroidobacteraceae bacterium]|nr:protein kinase [Steroidobacteraceae bacterium]
MNEFRASLEAYLSGKTDLAALENALRASLKSQPHLAAAHSAIIEAMARTQRLKPDARDALHRIVQGAAAPAATPPAPPATKPVPGAKPAAPADESPDKTQFRMPASKAPSTPPTPPAEPADKTQFRPHPATGNPPPAAPAAESADKTQFRMPKPGAARAPASPAPAAPAPATSSTPDNPPAPPAADRTQLRARPQTTGAARPPAPPAPPPAPRPSAPAGKLGSLSDLVGAPDGEAAPAAPPPSTNTGTGPVTGTSPSQGTGGWTGGTGTGGTGKRTGASGGSSGWSHLADGAAGAAPLQPGDTIKDRFVLEDIIGKGGMGIVFKARDLRWEEAQDRNPYVAVKVLNEDFKRHPESLKALQRESRKAQNLAHPNVVTVYQFDRDGANVFMVMELLEGEPLDKFIKRHDAGGMPAKTALKYTAHMARALAYAHEQGIIHSDFKPANAYITRDGVVKVFDFGISRAAKRSDKVSGSMTLFDPGTLGALTPAYASVEMIEGEEPDPRDDIYALACVFYELLTGKHPFNKQSAVQARDAKMSPAPVPGLARSQWKGLQKGLSFKREQRSASVMSFLNDVSPQRTSPAKWIAVAAGVVVIGVGVALFLPGYLEKRRLQEIAEIFRGGEDALVPEALERLAKLTPEQRGTLLTDQGAREGLLTYFEKQIDAATDESKQRYEFTRAFALIARAQAIFPDSSRVDAKKKALEDRQNDLINRLSRRFDDALAKGWLIDDQNSENASKVLAVLKKVQPNHPLLTDKRLVIAYVEQADSALDRSNVALADKLIAGGLALAPQDSSLKDLGDRVRVAAASQQSAQRVRTLRASIDTALGASPALEAFDRKRNELAELRSVAPDDSALARWQTQMQAQLDRRLADLSAKRSFTDAEALLGQYAELASAAYVADRRDNLTTARKDFTDRLGKLGDSLLAAIRAGRLGPPAPDNARSIYQQLERSGADAEQLAAAKDQISSAYVRLARELRSKGSFDEARRQVGAGLDFGPSASVVGILRDESKEIDDSERLARAAADQATRDQLAAQRTKEDNDFKAQLAAALKAPNPTIDSARAALVLAEKLQNRGVKDPLVATARNAIQNQLLAQSRALSQQSGPDAAIRYAEQASALMPESTALVASLNELRKASADRQAQTRVAAITAIKTDIDTLIKAPKLDDQWYRNVNAQLRRLAAYLPDTDPYVVGVKRNAADMFVAAARKSRDAKSLSEADRYLQRAGELVPTSAEVANERRLLADARAAQGKEAQQTKLAADTEALKQRLRDQAKADDTEFLATLKNLRQMLPENDAFLATDAPMLMADSYLRMAAKAARRGSYDEAVKLLDRGLENAPKLVSLRTTRTRYADLQALSEQIASAPQLTAREFRAVLDPLAKADASLYADVGKRLKSALDARVRLEKSRNAALAANFEALGAQVFPEQRSASAAAAATTPATRPATPPPAATQTVATPPAADAVTTTPVSMQQSGANSKLCKSEFQAQGRRAQAVCYDGIANGRGPDLVVLPPGGPFSGPVAVTRFEITNEDFNFYCTATGRCKTVTAGPRLPLVSVGAADAERYAAWLSESSGKIYRLPTDAEWTYVATGIPDGADFNCTMEVGGQKVKGFALAERNSGSATKWGVYNIVGNAQEWARAPGGWVARGGSFADNVSNCGVALGRVHNGAADGKTGFRLVREF